MNKKQNSKKLEMKPLLKVPGLKANKSNLMNSSKPKKLQLKRLKKQSSKSLLMSQKSLPKLKKPQLPFKKRLLLLLRRKL